MLNTSDLLRLFLYFFLFVLAIALYYNGLSVPFYMDDFQSIRNNPLLASASLDDVAAQYPMREIGYVSFALQVQLFGYGVESFRIVNILLHSVAGFLVMILSAQIMSISKVYEDARQITFISFIVGALFIVLPLNSQPVIYIVQRVTLLACVFALLTIVSYIALRCSEGLARKILFSTLCVIGIAGGLMSKQNYVTIFPVIVLLEVLLLQGIRKSTIKHILLLMLSAVMLLNLIDFAFSFGIFAAIDQATRTLDTISRWEYFSHQLPILWMYIYKFFVPYPLLLEYGVTRYTWSDWQVWLSFFAFLGLFFTLYSLRNRIPVFVFLISSYFITHSLESSLFPITDLVFEHRTYLPNVFLALAAVLLLFKVTARKPKVFASLSLAAIIGFSSITYGRIALWKEPMEFYRQNLTHVENNPRAYGALALLYAHDRNYLASDHWYSIAIQESVRQNVLIPGTVIGYIEMLQESGEVGKARRVGVQLMREIDSQTVKAHILATLAIPYVQKGDCEFAMGMINSAKNLDPSNARVAKLLRLCISDQE